MSSRKGLTLIEVLVVTLIIFMLALLLLPATRSASDAARRTNCTNHVKQILLAALNHESQHGHFPLAMRGTAAPINQVGPQPFSENDGYSFAVSLLPYMDEPQLADEIAAASGEFQQPLNSANFHTGRDGQGSLWDSQVELLLCPSFPGEDVATGSYGDVRRPQVSNYHAMVSACAEGPDQRLIDDDPTFGGVLVTESASNVGVTIREIIDGTSKTIMIAESRSERWSAWFSGSSVSLAALSPDHVVREDLGVDKGGWFTVPEKTPSSLNCNPYWSNNRAARDWGASSAHSGMVIHGFSDGHVTAINQAIDSTTYFRMATRGGGEPADNR